VRTLLAFPLFVALVACQASAEDQGEPSPTPAAISPQRIIAANLRPGEKCQVWLKSSPPSVHRSGDLYIGLVSKATNEEVELTNATKERWSEHIVPILGHTPIIGPFFRYVSIAGHEDVGVVQISIANVEMIQ
jgi:hypothetical protein